MQPHKSTQDPPSAAKELVSLPWMCDLTNCWSSFADRLPVWDAAMAMSTSQQVISSCANPPGVVVLPGAT